MLSRSPLSVGTSTRLWMLAPTIRRNIAVTLAALGIQAATPNRSYDPAEHPLSYPEAGLPEDLLRSKRWGHLAGRLMEAGVDSSLVAAVFGDTRMPAFTGLSFYLGHDQSKPRDNYGHFLRSSNVRRCCKFMKTHKPVLAEAAVHYGVEAEVITAILSIESGFGKNTGRFPAVFRIARLASAAEMENLAERIIAYEGKFTAEEVQKRALDLEKMFLPQLVSLLTVYPEGSSFPFSIKGSSAGAIGAPQFMPRSYELYAVDGDRNGFKNLHNLTDAAFSVANFLNAHGWSESLVEEERLSVLRSYNNSRPYCETVLKLADHIKRQCQKPG